MGGEDAPLSFSQLQILAVLWLLGFHLGFSQAHSRFVRKKQKEKRKKERKKTEKKKKRERKRSKSPNLAAVMTAHAVQCLWLTAVQSPSSSDQPHTSVAVSWLPAAAILDYHKVLPFASGRLLQWWNAFFCQLSGRKAAFPRCRILVGAMNLLSTCSLIKICKGL